MSGLTVKGYDANEITELKKGMKSNSVVFEAKLIKDIEDYIDDEGNSFSSKTLIKFYMKMMNGAMKTNKFGDEEPDNKARMGAADKILKIMTGGIGNNKGVTINVQNNNLWTGQIPSIKEKLKY